MTAISSNTGTLASGIGLVTGLNIDDTVTKLMSIASQTKDNLTARTQTLSSEQTAFTQLTSLLVAFQFEAKQLGDPTKFTSRQVSSSDETALTGAVSTDGNPAVGSYVFTPVQTASSQQLLSQVFGASEAVGAGTLTFGSGGFVDSGISLDQLNGGAGIQRGQIRVTDRSGASTVIDLSYARSVDDVLDAINSATDINVTATAVGDSFKLTDNSGGSGNLKVQEVGGGKTASSLGLAGIDVAAASATGGDVFTLSNKTSLSTLNDGTGVQLRTGNDLSVSLADGSSINLDLGDAKTLGDVINKINAASAGKFTASISSDGTRLQLKDLTTGSDTFAVTNVGTGTAADDLGLTGSAPSDTISGKRLVSGLRDTLTSSLKGGVGLGTLGEVSITNRNNVTSSVDLSGVETLGDIVAAINAHAPGVTASVNSARNGIQLTDTTGGTASNFVVTNGDSSGTASALGIVTNSESTTVNGGGLQRRQISAGTLLSSLNGGAGIQVGDLKITGTDGAVGAVDLNKVGDIATTVGDVLTRINELSSAIGVTARINDRGDGIELIDTAGGSGGISVSEVGNGTTAKDLHLLGTSAAQTVNGVQRQVLDGTATATVAIDSNDTLSDVVSKINALNRGVTASILNDGTQQRLSLSANNSGAANELLVDTSNTNLSLQEISSGRDALVVYGSSGSGGVLVSSSTNQFKNIVSGLDLTVQNGSQSPVTINVATTSDSLVSTANDFVSAYNSVRTTLDKLTAFDPTTLTTGILFGTSETLRVDSSISQLVGAKYFGAGQYDSLASVGITLDDKGQMQLDQSKLTAAFNSDPDSVKKLFTDDKVGISTKLNDTLEQLAGANNSVLSSRVDALKTTINDNNDRITQMTDQLSKQRDGLLAQFDNLETTIAGLKQNLDALQSLQIIPPLNSTNNSSSSSSSSSSS
jgi:flagellar hook-associated protein 2